MRSPLPNFPSSLTKYIPVEEYYKLLKSIGQNTPEREVRSHFGPEPYATAKQRFLIVKNGVVIRDRLIDLIHQERTFTKRVKRVMYFLFMFRDSRYRDFICNVVGKNHGKWITSIFQTQSTRYFEDVGGRKAFTNLRQFLLQTNAISDKWTALLTISDLENWFPIAVEVAAQSVSDVVARQNFLTDPYDFLIRNGINALVNATPEELTGAPGDRSYEEAENLLPRIELDETKESIDTSDFHNWSRLPPAQRKDRVPYETVIDPVLLERANSQHYLLEELLFRLCGEHSVVGQQSRLVDLCAKFGDTTVVFEMKSCRSTAVRAQLRRAISQLFEYRYIYRDRLGPDVRLCAVVERRPRGKTQWLLGYLEHLGIGLIWKNDDNSKLNCTEFTAKLLGDVLPKVKRKDFAPD